MADEKEGQRLDLMRAKHRTLALLGQADLPEDRGRELDDRLLSIRQRLKTLGFPWRARKGPAHGQ